MATSKKNTGAAPAAASVKDEASVLAPKTPVTAKSAAAKPAAATAAATKAAAAKPATPKPAAKKPAAPAKSSAKASKPVDSAVQASKEALARALAAAQAVKIEKPLGKPEKAEKAAKPVKEAKAVKPKKPKLVRDSFTMPENEYACIAELKKRLLDKGMVAKKSELLRAGVALLASLDDAALVTAVQKVEIIKTGRPAKSGK